MKNLLIFLAIFFCSPITAISQTLHLGLKAEFYAYNFQGLENTTNYSDDILVSPLPSLYIVLMKDFSESVSVNIKPGILFRPESFEGFEIGASVNYKIPENDFFITAGPNIHFTQESAHGTSIVEAVDAKTIFFLSFGAGYQFTKRFMIDLTYHKALNGEYGYNYVSLGTFNKSGPLKINSMIKIGLAFIY